MAPVDHSLPTQTAVQALTLDRFNVLGVNVSITNMQNAMDVADDLIRSRRRGYICVTGVHGVMESQSDEDLLLTHNESLLTVPDGMPLVWLERSSKATTISDEFMALTLWIELSRRAAERQYKVFLYGGAPGVAQDLKLSLEAKVRPGLNVVGTHSTPPFRPLNEAEEVNLISQVAECQPDIIWVGLSTPKQERFSWQKFLPLLSCNSTGRCRSGI